MIFLFLLPPYLAVVIYMLVRFFHWLKNCNHRFNWKRFKIPFTVAYIAVALSPLLAFVLPKSAFAVVVRRISTYWMGVLMYSAIAVAVFEILRLIAKHTKLKNTKLFSRGGTVTIGSIVTACAVLVCVYGGINARNIRVTEYSVSVDKKCEGIDELNVVLVADLHLGYSIGVKHMERMVDKINQQDADLVIVAGDIFDNRRPRGHQGAVPQNKKQIRHLRDYGQSRYRGDDPYGLYFLVGRIPRAFKTDAGLRRGLRNEGAVR